MNRRHFLRGLFAAPAIVAASSLMPVRGIIMPVGSPFREEWSQMWPATDEDYSDLTEFIEWLRPKAITYHLNHTVIYHPKHEGIELKKTVSYYLDGFESDN